MTTVLPNTVTRDRVNIAMASKDTWIENVCPIVSLNSIICPLLLIAIVSNLEMNLNISLAVCFVLQNLFFVRETLRICVSLKNKRSLIADFTQWQMNFLSRWTKQNSKRRFPYGSFIAKRMRQNTSLLIKCV